MSKPLNMKEVDIIGIIRVTKKMYFAENFSDDRISEYVDNMSEQDFIKDLNCYVGTSEIISADWEFTD